MEVSPNMPVLAVVSDATPTATFFKRKFKESFHVMQFRDSAELFDTMTYTKISLFVIEEKVAEIDQVFAMCSKIREHASYEKTPILLITNNLKKDFLRQAMHAGVSECLNSPLDEQEVHARVEKVTQTKVLESKISSLTSRIASPIGISTKKIQGKRIFSADALQTVEEALATKTALSLLLLAPSIQGESVKKFLKLHLRPNDKFFPLDAEQFVLLLPKTSPRAAQMIAETLISEAQKTTPPFSLSGSLVFLKLSEAKTTAYDEIESLISLSKKGLEEAKKREISLFVG